MIALRVLLRPAGVERALARRLADNLSYALDSLQRAVMASKLHRQNILNKTYDHMAVGVVKANDSLWITVIFYG